MRSLAAKLTLAFLIVGITGALLVALFMGRQTRSAFDRFVLQSYQRQIVDGVTEYYENYGSWEEITGSAPPRMNPRLGGMRPGAGDRPVDLFTLADMDGDGKQEIVVASKPAYVGVLDGETGDVKFEVHYEIEDPYGGPESAFVATYERIRACVDALVS